MYYGQKYSYRGMNLYAVHVNNVFSQNVRTTISCLKASFISHIHYVLYPPMGMLACDVQKHLIQTTNASEAPNQCFIKLKMIFNISSPSYFFPHTLCLHFKCWFLHFYCDPQNVFFFHVPPEFPCVCLCEFCPCSVHFLWFLSK